MATLSSALQRGFGSERNAPGFHAAMSVLIAALMLIDFALAKLVHLDGFIRVFDIWPGVLILFACACYCRRRPLPRLIESCNLALVAVGLTNALSLLIQIAGRSPSPLVDRQLSEIDGLIRFHTGTIVQWIAGLPVLQTSLQVVYSSLPALVIAAVLVPPILGHRDAARRYILGVVLAAVVTTLLFALWPAVGPWSVDAFAPSRDQAAVDAYLTRLKSDAPVALDMSNSGIVSFPSFHVVLAILSAVSLGSIRRLRAAVWTLAFLICVSTVTTGWHYGIDVFGGLGVAVFSIVAARRLMLLKPDRESAWALNPASSSLDLHSEA